MERCNGQIKVKEDWRELEHRWTRDVYQGRRTDQGGVQCTCLLPGDDIDDDDACWKNAGRTTEFPQTHHTPSPCPLYSQDATEEGSHPRKCVQDVQEEEVV